MPKTNDTTNLAIEAYRKIKLLMLQRKISAGQKLLYREMIEWLNMSKTPIINALNRLEQDGLIISEANRGFYVKPMELQEIMESYQVREALESKAIELAIQNAGKEELTAISEKADAYDGFRQYNFDKKMMFNAEFHLEIATAAKNQILKYLLRQNLQHMILRLHLDSFPAERMDVSSKEHKLLLEAIRNKDLKKSLKLLKDHLTESRDHILSGISSKEIDSKESLAFFEN